MFIYSSISGYPVNIGSYVIVGSGVSFSENIPALDKYVGVTLARTDDGDTITPKTGLLEKGTIPIIVPPDGTIDALGAITLGTALQFTYPKAWIFLPASAVVSGLAGLYYVEFTSTTVGTVYTNYVNAATTTFTARAPTTIGSAAVGSAVAFTTVVTTDHTIANITVPANTLGTSGNLSVRSTFATSTSANAKTIKVNFGNLNISTVAPTTSLSFELDKVVYNTATNKQVASSAVANYGTGSGGVLVKGTVDTTTDVSVTITAQTHTTDAGAAHIVLEALTLQATSE